MCVSALPGGAHAGLRVLVAVLVAHVLVWRAGQLESHIRFCVTEAGAVQDDIIGYFLSVRFVRNTPTPVTVDCCGRYQASAVYHPSKC